MDCQKYKAGQQLSVIAYHTEGQNIHYDKKSFNDSDGAKLTCLNNRS